MRCSAESREGIRGCHGRYGCLNIRNGNSASSYDIQRGTKDAYQRVLPEQSVGGLGVLDG